MPTDDTLGCHFTHSNTTTTAAADWNWLHHATRLQSQKFIKCQGPYSSQELQNYTGTATSPPISTATLNWHLDITFLIYLKTLYSDTWHKFVMSKIRLKKTKTSCTYNFKHRDLVQLQGFLGRFADSEGIILGGAKKVHLYTRTLFYQFLPILNSSKQLLIKTLKKIFIFPLHYVFG